MTVSRCSALLLTVLHNGVCVSEVRLRFSLETACLTAAAIIIKTRGRHYDQGQQAACKTTLHWTRSNATDGTHCLLPLPHISYPQRRLTHSSKLFNLMVIPDCTLLAVLSTLCFAFSAVSLTALPASLLDPLCQQTHKIDPLNGRCIQRDIISE